MNDKDILYKDFSYKTTAKSTNCRARTGVFTTPHGDIETPIFMPVGTQASVKGLSPEEVTCCGAQIMLANTYHLYLRPGAEIVEKAGGLHKFMNWKKPVLTDSGGFQVFSLADMRKIDNDGVTFKSHLDGSVFTFTPELNMEVQHKLGADIIMQLDICEKYGAGRQETKAASDKTSAWLARCFAAHKLNNEKRAKENKPPQALFPIVQGGFYTDLRLESLHNALPYAGNGLAIGGIAIGEPISELTRILDCLAPELPERVPHYLMGAGTPDYILEAVMRGVDMFDCVYQTRVARNGLAMTDNGTMNLKNSKYREDFTPIQSGCTCYACKNFSRTYIRHLIIAKEMFAARLISIHNLHWSLEFMKKIRESIKSDMFLTFRKDFYKHYYKTDI